MMASPLRLEQMVAGERPEDQDPQVQAALARLRVEDSVYRSELAPSLKARWDRARKARGRRTLVTLTMGSAAAALALVLGVSTLWGPGGRPDTRVKGAGPTLVLYHRTDAGTETLGPQAQLGAGAEVQAAYQVAQGRFVALVAVDGRGGITPLLPLEGDEAVQATSSDPTLLPYSYRLDRAPNYEAVYLVASDQPFQLHTVTPVLAAAQGRTEGVPWPAGFEVTGLRITKLKELLP